MDYQDFTLRLESNGDGDFRVRVSSPAGEGNGIFQPPGDRSRREAFRLALGPGIGATRDLASQAPATPGFDPVEAGQELFEALFQGQVLELFLQSLGHVRGRGGQGLRLQLRFDRTDPDLAALSSLPWELLRSRGGGFLALDRSTPIVHYLEVDRPVVPLPLEGPLRVLAVVSDPEGVAALDLEAERRRIEATWGRELGVEVDFLDHPTVPALRDALLDRPAHVLHFMGHGTFDEGTGQGSLLFEMESGQAEPVTGSKLAHHLQLPQPPALVVLNACHTGRSVSRQGLDPFAGVATALVKGGLLAVVAMQYAISDTAAIAFCGTLYRRMAAGDGVDAAVTEGRLAIHGAEGTRPLEWAIPVLFLRAGTGRVVDIPRASPQITQQIRDFSGYIEEKTRGFVGRKFVFDAIDQFASGNPRGYFFVRGDPGIGKTALLAEMAKQGGHAHHFNIRTRNIAGTADFLRNLCAQLIARHRLGVSSLPPEATKDSGFLTTLLGQVSKQLRDGQRIFVLVDALDEADRTGLAPGANTLCLPEALPGGVFFVITTRRDTEVNLPIRIDCEQRTLFLEHDSQDNLSDVEVFVQNHLAMAGIQRYLQSRTLDDKVFVEEMVAKSEGNFMYLHCVLPEIANGFYAGRPLAEIPQGLENYYQDHWTRMKKQDEDAWLRYKLPVIMALTVAAEPVPLDAVRAFSGVEDPVRVLSVLRDWQAFLHEDRVPGDKGGEEKRYRLYHLSFLEFLKKKDEVEVSFRLAHERILEVLAGLS